MLTLNPKEAYLASRLERISSKSRVYALCRNDSIIIASSKVPSDVISVLIFANNSDNSPTLLSPCKIAEIASNFALPEPDLVISNNSDSATPDLLKPKIAKTSS